MKASAFACESPVSSYLNFGLAEVVMITGIVDESGNYESDELKHLCVTSVTWISSRSFPINTRIILPREKKFYT